MKVRTIKVMNWGWLAFLVFACLGLIKSQPSVAILVLLIATGPILLTLGSVYSPLSMGLAAIAKWVNIIACLFFAYGALDSIISDSKYFMGAVTFIMAIPYIINIKFLHIKK